MFETREVSPGMGHNRPPESIGSIEIETAKANAAQVAGRLPDWLGQRDKALLKRIEDLLAATKRAPKKVTSKVEAEKMSDFRSQIAAAAKAADQLREIDKKAFEEPAKAVHGFWKKRIDELNAATAQTGLVLTAYLTEERRKAAEAAKKAAEKQAAEAAKRQAPPPPPPPPKPTPVLRGDGGSHSGLRNVWTFRNLDRSTLDLEALRPYLADVALEAAVRQAIGDGVRELKGVEIYEKPVITTR